MALVAAVVFVASVIPTTAGQAGPLPDAFLHALAYATLGLALAYATSNVDSDRVRIVLVFVGASAFGLAVELVQAPLPYRSLDHVDALANGAGAVLALLWLRIEPFVRYVDVLEG